MIQLQRSMHIADRAWSSCALDIRYSLCCASLESNMSNSRTHMDVPRVAKGLPFYFIRRGIDSPRPCDTEKQGVLPRTSWPPQSNRVIERFIERPCHMVEQVCTPQVVCFPAICMATRGCTDQWQVRSQSSSGRAPCVNVTGRYWSCTPVRSTAHRGTQPCSIGRVYPVPHLGSSLPRGTQCEVLNSELSSV
eukprot:1148207-Pelagomonas_calceolata.AAC.2